MTEIGVQLPTMEIGNDAGLIRDFAQAAEALNYAHIVVQEHVLGADPTTGSFRENGWVWGPSDQPGVTKDAAIHEPMVLFGYLAAVTSRVGLGTMVLVLPQRQTALLAKQAAEVDLLSKGRLRLGVGAGWNPVEFEGLGADFSSRGRREEEQIELLRLLWSNDVVDFRGNWDRIDHAGINPLPGRRIPIWVGGAREVALKRAARLGDGYMPLGLSPGDAARQMVERLKGYLAAAGRSFEGFGLEGALQMHSGTPEDWRTAIEKWKDIGATHLTLRLGGLNPDHPRRFIDAMERYAREAISR